MLWSICSPHLGRPLLRLKEAEKNDGYIHTVRLDMPVGYKIAMCSTCMGREFQAVYALPLQLAAMARYHTNEGQLSWPVFVYVCCSR
jgi:hypothetical protein